MGLDMYAYVVHPTAVKGEFDFEYNDDGPFVLHHKFFYWRKNHDLHEWMEKLYRKKAGDKAAAAFNCIAMRLHKGDLLDLQEYIENREYYPEEQKTEDLEFVSEALEHLRHGRAVYYDSWW